MGGNAGAGARVDEPSLRLTARLAAHAEPVPARAQAQAPTEVHLLQCAAYLGPVSVHKLTTALHFAQHSTQKWHIQLATVCANYRMDSPTLTAAIVQALPRDAIQQAAEEGTIDPCVVQILKVFDIIYDLVHAASENHTIQDVLCTVLEHSTNEPRALMLHLALAVLRTGCGSSTDSSAGVDSGPGTGSHAYVDELPPEQALNIWAPLATRTSLWRLQAELEDYAFRIMHPETHREVQQVLENRLPSPHATLEDARAGIEVVLAQARLIRNSVRRVRVLGRVKGTYSVHRKMTTRGKSIEQVFDVLALRVIVQPRGNTPSDERDACFAVADAVTDNYPAVENRRKDYIQNPKPNGYKALHLTVMLDVDANAHPLEVQIRSENMHNIAEFGTAALPILCKSDDDTESS